MGFLDKPKWYGVPVLVRANVRVLLRSRAIVFGIAMLIAIVAAGLVWDSPDDRLIVPVQAFVGSSTIIIFSIGWFVAVFFWLRAFVNVIRMNFNRSEAARFWSIKGLYIPFYGWRAVDFTVEGVRYRRLATEGFIGFVTVMGVIWLFVLASKAVGIDFETS